MLALNQHFWTFPPSVLGRLGVKALSKFYIPVLPGFLINLKQSGKVSPKAGRLSWCCPPKVPLFHFPFVLRLS